MRRPRIELCMSPHDRDGCEKTIDSSVYALYPNGRTALQRKCKTK